MTDNIAVVQEYMELLINRGRFDESRQYVADENLLGLATMWHDAFSDLHVTIDDQFATGNTVTSLVTLSGTHSGVFFGIEPSGRQVRFSGIAVDEVVDGKVVAARHEVDVLDLFWQLGAEIHRTGRPRAGAAGCQGATQP
jgi:predicted ester cyclase